jgi:ribosome biogenesis protein ERB1
MSTRAGKASAAPRKTAAAPKVVKQSAAAKKKEQVHAAELVAAAAAEASPQDSEESGGSEEEMEGSDEGSGEEEGSDEEEESESDFDGSEEGFEDQGSSTDESELLDSEDGMSDSGSDEEAEGEKEGGKLGPRVTQAAESSTRSYPTLQQRDQDMDAEVSNGIMELKRRMHTDDMSSDDEEDLEANTIGRVPLHWYDAYDHVGYNITGQKVAKRKGQDKIDTLISNHGVNGGEARRTVYDMYNDREVVLSARDLEIIRRIQAGAFAHAEHDDTPDYVDYFTHEVEPMPLSAAPDAKRQFTPSKWETMRVMKIVKAIKEGRYVDTKQQRENKKKEDDIVSDLFLAWNDQEDETLAESKKFAYHLPAPKIPLPGHAESYNPPSEYLLSDKEKQEFEDMDPADRPYNFIPKQHSCLRHVDGYAHSIRERFERCLDLYLCPRQLKKRLNIDPETLIPRLPRPKELKPFPNSLCLQYLGHTKAVRSISLSPDGQYLVSGSDDGTVMLWEVDCCLCRYVWDFKGVPVTTVAWNPNPSHHVVACVVGKAVVFIATGTGDADSTEVTDSLLEACEQKAVAQKGDSDSEEEEEEEEGTGKSKNMKKKSLDDLAWKKCESSDTVAIDGNRVGPRVELGFPSAVTKLAWHHRGDYFGVLCPNAGAHAVTIHQVCIMYNVGYYLG